MVIPFPLSPPRPKPSRPGETMLAACRLLLLEVELQAREAGGADRRRAGDAMTRWLFWWPRWPHPLNDDLEEMT